ncbi:MAG: UMP kinase [Zavarzinella sp.]
MTDSSQPQLKYKRVLLKMSGEALGFPGQSGISLDETMSIAQQVKTVVDMGVELAIVVGGGNILRGAQFSARGDLIDHPTADYMGMLATIMNGMALQEVLEKNGVETRLLTSLRVDNVAEYFVRRRALRHLFKKRVVILAGGTGNTGVTTDTAAALRAVELECDIVLKATKVDGIYSEDPEKNPHAIFYPRLTFSEVIEQRLKVMDAQAFSTCSEKDVPILVFNFKRPGNIERAVTGQQVGTLVSTK